MSQNIQYKHISSTILAVSHIKERSFTSTVRAKEEKKKVEEERAGTVEISHNPGAQVRSSLTSTHLPEAKKPKKGTPTKIGREM
jgi:hypothetical protein